MIQPKSDEKGNLFLFPMSGTGGGFQDSSDKEWRNVDSEHDVFPNGFSPFAAIDFETYYSTSYSLAKLTTWEYVNHQAFDAYLVAIEFWNGTNWMRWVGHPTKAPWLDLNKIEWVSHNAGFDELVYKKLQNIKEVPSEVYPIRWNCTADMSAYFQAGRNLKLATLNFFNTEISKEIRSKMKDGNASEAEVRDYAAKDSYWCAKIWVKMSPKWNESEKVLSIVTRKQGWKGFQLDYESAVRSIKHLENIKSEIKNQIPWGNKGAITSLKNFAYECGKYGIHAPLSLAEDSESAIRWEKTHGSKFPWIKLIKRHTKANQIQGSLKLMKQMVRKDGSVPFQMKYCQTHTKRWQHADGIRMQNLDKDPVEGVHLRHHLVARKGHVFIIADLSQIEPRVLNWRAGNTEFLKLCSQGISPYEAHARSSMGYTKKEPLKEGNPKIYALAKARVLALGYQSGAEQFQEMAYSMAGLDISLTDQTMLIGKDVVRFKNINEFLATMTKEQTELYAAGKFDMLPSAMSVVQDFRRSSTEIVSLWNERQASVRSCEGKDYMIKIQNGSSLRYFDVKVKEQRRWSRDGKPYTTDDITAWVVKNSPNIKDKKHLYGGKIVENEVQWISREVFADCCFRTCFISDINLLWTAHDEGIWEVKEEIAEQRLQDIQEIMKTSPWWANDLPIDSSAEIVTHYKK